MNIYSNMIKVLEKLRQLMKKEIKMGKKSYKRKIIKIHYDTKII
jgi:hypothetical protein